MNTYRILIVDDMLVNLKILDKILTSEGYEVVLASSGEEALKHVSTQEFHTILLDIIMPNLNGFDVISKLKDIPVICDIPVIFITGEESPETLVRGFEMGAVDYITKPFHPYEIKARVRSHIKLFSTLQSLATAQAETLKQINNAQNSLLKKPEDFPEANFSVYYCSLHAAGGDIYDIIKISDSKIGYFVGDFAGHQISTSFLTSSVKALLQQNCTDLLSPVESMTMVNTVLCQLMKPGQYLTGSYAVLDLESHEITVVNMGHPPLILIQTGGAVIEMGKPGDVIGIFEDAMYREDTLKLLPTDRFILYTDGMIEGTSVWSAYTKPLKDKITIFPQLEREQFITHLMKETEEFRGDVDDDIMVLVVDVPGELPSIERLKTEQSYIVRFPSVIRFSSTISHELYDWIEEKHPMKTQAYGTKLILNEVITNAITHGNNNDILKLVTASINITDNCVKIRVEDEGNGFNWKDKIHKKGSINSTTAQNGRGLPLFNSYGFTAEYNDKGNSVTLSLELS